MLCCWFVVGLIEEELVEEGREDMANHHERERQSIESQNIVKGKGLSIELLRFFFFFFWFYCFECQVYYFFF